MWIWSDPWIKVSLHHHVKTGKLDEKMQIFFVKMISRKKSIFLDCVLIQKFQKCSQYYMW